MGSYNPSPSLPALPVELWDLIFTHLWYPDLTAVALTCKTFNDLAHNHLRHHRALWSKWHHVQHDVGNLFHDSDPVTGRLLPTLLAVLRDPAVPHYVEHLDFYSGASSMWDKDPNPKDLDQQPHTPSPSDLKMINDALHHEHLWSIQTPLGHSLRLPEAILTHGSENAMAALLILKCPNLRSLSLPTTRNRTLHNPWLAKILSTLSLLAGSKQKAGPPLPLSKLEYFECYPFETTIEDRRGVYWSQLTAIMALPSVRRLRLHNLEGWAWDSGSSGSALPEWPAHLPKSNVREIEIVDGTVPRKAVLHFARGIRGPCTIRQTWLMAEVRNEGGWCCGRAECGIWIHSRRADVLWDELVVPYAGAPEHEWTVVAADRRVEQCLDEQESVRRGVLQREDEGRCCLCIAGC